MKRPFLHIFIFFSLGIIYSHIIKVDISLVKLLFLLTIAFLAIIFILKQQSNNICKYISLISIFLIAIIITNHRVEKHELAKLYNENIEAIGTIKEVTVKEESYEKYILNIEQVKYKGKIYNINEKTILSIYDQADLDLGDKISGRFKIKEPKTNTNPKLFNYRLHLNSKNIFTTASCDKKNNVKVLSRGNLNAFEKTSYKARKHIIKTLDSALNTNNSNIIKSIILGDDSFLAQENINKFRKLGLSHILAVSGLHIGIIFAFIIYILDLLKVHRKISMTIAIVIIWIYAGIIGFPSSVLRASLMFGFLTLGKIIHNRYDAINIISFSGFLMLVYRPMWIFNIGFQLSFTATFMIVIFLPKIKDIISIKSKKLKAALAIVLTAQLVVAPISIYYFNEFHVLSIISNLIIAPLIVLGLIIGFIIIIVSTLSISLGIAAGVLGNFVLNLANTMVIRLSKITVLNIWIKSPSYLEIAFYYLALFLIFKVVDIGIMDKKIQRCLYINFIIVLIVGCFMNLNKKSVSVEFIDVGQGDSCLIRLKDKNILIDGGGSIFGDFDIGDNILLPYLRKSGVKTIDGVFISHYHADHVKGLFSLFGNLNIGSIFVGYENPENDLYKQLIYHCNKSNVKANLINRGDKIKLDSDTYLEVIYPPKTILDYDNENDKSLVFILNIYNKEILFTGDIEEKSEDYIIKNTKDRNVDIIKVAHHGSKTSSKVEFINAFNPKLAVIQVGTNNFGHPSLEVLDRYLDNKTKIFRNDESGLVTANINKSNIKVEEYLKDKKTLFEYIDIYLVYGIYITYIGAICLMMLEYRERQDRNLSDLR